MSSQAGWSAPRAASRAPGRSQVLLRYLRPQRAAVALMALSLLASAGASLLGPAIAGRFIDGAVAGAGTPTLRWLAAAFLAASAAAQLTAVASTYTSQGVAWRATNGLRQDLMRRLLSQPLSVFAHVAPGELLERVDGDVNLLAAFFSSLAVQVAGSALVLVGALAAMTIVAPVLGGVFAFLVVGASMGMDALRRRSVARIEAERAESARAYGALGEVVAAAQDLRGAGAQAYGEQRFLRRLARWRPAYVRAEVRGYMVWAVALAALGLGDAVVYALTGHLFLEGRMALGTVYALVAYAALVAQPIESIRQQAEQLQRADACLGRVAALFALAAPAAGGEALPTGALSLRLVAVSYRHADAERDDSERGRALSGIDLDLDPGMRLGVVGRTGAGKTTLARLIAGLAASTSGRVEIAGVDIGQVSKAALGHRVLYLPQEPVLFAATVRDNVALFDHGLPDRWIEEALREVGMWLWTGRVGGLHAHVQPQQLSSGEAQLLALARVFARNPGLVVLDEPSSRLDPEVARRANDAIDRALAGRTAVVVAHRLATLDHVDRIAVIEAGRLVEYGARTALAGDAGSRFAALLRTAQSGVLRA